MRKVLRDPACLIAGAIFTVVGLAFMKASLSYSVGTLTEMGPGFFPLVLGSILAVLGIAVAASQFSGERARLERLSIRALLVVLASVVLFGILIRGAGLVPAVTALVIVSSFAGERISWLSRSVLAIGLAAFSYFAFSIGLGLPFPAFGPWFGG